jgi:N-acetylmuramoyl-L-alanine amidase
MRQIKRIFVHCTAGPQTQTVAEIQKYWKNVNKWKSPGYHYIIKPDGEIVPLQPEDKPSNGVAGYNSTSINVCYIGGVDKQGRAVDNRTDAQKESLIKILKDLKSRYPDAEILGHREIWGQDPSKWHKMCPCFPAKAEYEHIMDEPEPIEEHVEVEPEPIPEYPKPSIPNNIPESGEISAGGEEKQQSTRPNPIDFIIQLLKLIVKAIFRRK